MTNVDGASRLAASYNTAPQKNGPEGIGALSPTPVPARTPVGIDSKSSGPASSARSLRTLVNPGNPAPPAPYADLFKPERVEAFGGDYAAESVNPGVRGTAESPHAFHVSDRASAQQIMRRALGEPLDESRVAWTGTLLGATGDQFLASHSFKPCQPAVVFWKDHEQTQQATFFHLSGLLLSDEMQDRLDVIKEKSGNVMQIDSVCFIRKGFRPEHEDAYQAELAELAKKQGLKLQVLFSKNATTESMAVAIDVQNKTIATMDTTLLRGLTLPAPTRGAEFSLLEAKARLRAQRK